MIKSITDALAPLRAFLRGKKTYISALLLVIHAVSGYVTGEMGTSECVTLIIEALGLASIRKGIADK